jgi:hypothetical protein
MSYFRSYFEKNNTIIKKSSANTAKNPTTEIFYGSGFSKFLFKVDLINLQNRINSGDLVIDSNTKHTLKMTNTIFGDEGFKGQGRSTGRDRATSFNLIIFRIPEFWNEGVGFDYEDGGYDFSKGNLTFDVRPSNWFYRDTEHTWAIEGVYNDSPDIVATVNFDNGDENLEADITDYINGLLSGDVNNGLGIAFSVIYQDLNPANDQSVAFFTKYTQTFFEPFVESYFEDTVIDNRYNFIEKQMQNLYLFITKGTNFFDLDELPMVDIKDASGNVISGLNDLETVKVRKGVYKVNFGIDGVVCDGKRFYYDCWKNLVLDGIAINDVCQKFIPKPYTSLFSVGENPRDTNRYVIQFYGIQLNEKIKKGEKRKITIATKSIENPIAQVIGETYYRIFIYEGRTQVMVHDWTMVDSTNENFFYFDTEIYIPREYHLECKTKIHDEEIFHNELIKFEIVSEK